MAAIHTALANSLQLAKSIKTYPPPRNFKEHFYEGPLKEKSHRGEECNHRGKEYWGGIACGRQCGAWNDDKSTFSLGSGLKCLFLVHCCKYVLPLPSIVSPTMPQRPPHPWQLNAPPPSPQKTLKKPSMFSKTH